MRQSLTGTRIKERRLSIGLKQIALAKQTGISPSYLNLIEHNRRGIGGKILLKIAAALNVPPSALSGGADATLIVNLQKMAATAEQPVEIDRLEEMVGRFPGWAHQAAALQQKITGLERTLEHLNDRLTHDPFLSQSLHEILSNVTAIRATSGILRDVPDVDPEQKERFISNLHAESLRLSETSQALLSYFDLRPEQENNPTSPLEELETFLNANAYHFPAIETSEEEGIDQLIEQSGQLTSLSARQLALAHLEQYQADAKALPLENFQAKSRELAYAPDKLAAYFKCDLQMIFRRLAYLPLADHQPEFGFVNCDISGAIILRKPISGFSLPRYSAACPLWPLYQSITQPQIPIRAVLSTPEGSNFQTYAYCRRVVPAGFEGPQQFQASMLIVPTHTDTEGGSTPVGLSCRICPRKECTSRREPSILEAAQ